MEPISRLFLRSLELATFAHAGFDLELCSASLRSVLKDAGISSRRASSLQCDSLPQPLNAETALPAACSLLGIDLPDNVWLSVCSRIRENLVAPPSGAEADDSQTSFASDIRSPRSSSSGSLVTVASPHGLAILSADVSELQEFGSKVHKMSKRKLMQCHRSFPSSPDATNAIDRYMNCQLHEHVSSALVKDRLIDVLFNDLRAARTQMQAANRRADASSALVASRRQDTSSHPNAQLQLSWKGKVGNDLVSHDSNRKRWHLTESSKLAVAVRRTVANIPAYLFGAAAMTDISPDVVIMSEIKLNASLLASHRDFHAVLGLAEKIRRPSGLYRATRLGGGKGKAMGRGEEIRGGSSGAVKKQGPWAPHHPMQHTHYFS